MFCFTDLLIKQTISHHPRSGRSTRPRPRHLGCPPGPWSVSPVKTSGGKINTWAGDCLWTPAPTLTTGGAPGGWHVTPATIRVVITTIWSLIIIMIAKHHRSFLCLSVKVGALCSAHCPLSEQGWPYLETPSPVTTQQHQPQAVTAVLCATSLEIWW